MSLRLLSDNCRIVCFPGIKKIPSMGLASQSLGSSIMIGRLIIILTVDSLDFLAHELSVIFESLHFTVHLVNKAVAFLT